MSRRTLDVTGMKCEGCVESVTSALESVDGVRRADVSLEEGRADVETQATVTLDSLISAVESAGFEAKPAD